MLEPYGIDIWNTEIFIIFFIFSRTYLDIILSFFYVLVSKSCITNALQVLMTFKCI